MARALGTYKISVGPEECDVLGPKHPTTIADLDRLQRNEERVGGLLKAAEDCWSIKRTATLF